MNEEKTRFDAQICPLFSISIAFVQMLIIYSIMVFQEDTFHVGSTTFKSIFCIHKTITPIFLEQLLHLIDLTGQTFISLLKVSCGLAGLSSILGRQHLNMWLSRSLWQRKRELEGLTLALKCFSPEATHVIPAHRPLVRITHTVPPQREAAGNTGSSGLQGEQSIHLMNCLLS